MSDANTQQVAEQPAAGLAPWRRTTWVAAAVFVAASCAALAWAFTRRSSDVPVYGCEVVDSFPHDEKAFTQGLVYEEGGTLLESAGKYRRSSLRRVDLQTGEIQKLLRNSPRVFAEGITVWDDRIVQLTWKSRVAYVYDRETFRKVGTFRYRGEGWGITHDGRHLITSDGTSVLDFRDPKTFRVVRRVTVRDGRRPVDDLNELEYVDGEVWANVWGYDFIARIDPKDGRVAGWIDCSAIYPQNQRVTREDVFNGIAWDAKGERLFVTGKNWPRVYEIRLTGPRAE